MLHSASTLFFLSFPNLCHNGLLSLCFIIFASLLSRDVDSSYLDTHSYLGMASSKGTTAELDSMICIRVDRPARMDCLKPKGSFCKVLAVVEVRMKIVREGRGGGGCRMRWESAMIPNGCRYSLLRTRK